MKLDIMNPYTMKIMIAARPVDSISSISRRIGLSYGWTYHWVLELEKAGVFKRSGKKVFLKEGGPFYRRALGFLESAFGDDVDFHYKALSLFGIKYCFTSTDAVSVWTNGGYNIARYRGYYPIFIKVRSADREIFGFYTQKFGLGTNIFYKPKFLEDFPVEMHQGVPVDSLEETIAFMKKYVYNFQPALEIVQELYGRRLGVKYREAVLNA
jgi:DNA-binding Lrp family transcriptional regulator